MAEHGKIFKTTSVSNLSAFSFSLSQRQHKQKVNDTFLMTSIKLRFQNVISLTVMFEIMYLKPFKNFTYSNVSEQDKLYAVKKAKMKSSNADFVTWTSRLSPKRKLSILLNFFFPFIDIRCFFSSLKLQYR